MAVLSLQTVLTMPVGKHPILAMSVMPQLKKLSIVWCKRYSVETFRKSNKVKPACIIYIKL